MKTKKAKKAPKLYTSAEVAALVALARKTGYAKGQASCSNDHITVTAPLGELEPSRVYCLVRMVPLEVEQPKGAVGFST